MIPKRFGWLFVGLLVVLLALTACQAEPEQVEVVVTRIVEQVQEMEVDGDCDKNDLKFIEWLFNYLDFNCEIEDVYDE